MRRSYSTNSSPESNQGCEDDHEATGFFTTHSDLFHVSAANDWIDLSTSPHVLLVCVIGRERDLVKMWLAAENTETVFIWWALVAHPHKLFLFSSMWWALQNDLLSRFEAAITETLCSHRIDLMWLNNEGPSVYLHALKSICHFHYKKD